MISEEIQDQAALYALGLLDAGEAAAFEQIMSSDEEVRTFTWELNESAALLTLALPPAAARPSTALRTRILGQVKQEASLPPGSFQAVPSPGEHAGRVGRGSTWTWLPWAAAAVFMASCAVLALEQIRTQDRMRDLQARLTQALAQTGLVSQDADPLSQVSFCQLEPTPAGAARPSAAVLWDAVHRQGTLRLNQFQPPDAGKDYQLWVVEDGHKEPISAGVVPVGPDGSGQIIFKPVKPGNNRAQAFAISLEQAGGVPKNEGPILFVGKL